ncbi:DUF1015 family protein [Verrucomicrobia bacterium]|jgi:uncharacterized protein (DUF1015 family)|nr:DUF1015 family protein [Verrucomicrobiota bacterium]
MATLKPFKAVRPKKELAPDLCELPYDVLSSAEAREAAAGHPLSFFHVSKPEIDLPEGTDPYSDEVYSKGAENFQKLLSEGALYQDETACYYLYRQIMGDHSQTGIVAAASCQEYLDEIIKKHEFTRPDKENDRVRHIESLNAQTGPVFLTYRSNDVLNRIFEEQSSKEACVDITAPDGVRHTAWTISDEQVIHQIESSFEAISTLYIADGHHRSAAAGRIYESRKGAGSSGGFLTVVFPHDQMQILAYNRAVKDLNGRRPEEILSTLEGLGTLAESDTPVDPECKNELGVYMGNRWYRFQFEEKVADKGNAVEQLDVSLLQNHVLSPLLAIEDPRKSTRISFVGGIRGLGELEKLVDSGTYAIAFSMHPTRIEDLMQISDEGGIMPPKSTWFEPKLRDGMFTHLI